MKSPQFNGTRTAASKLFIATLCFAVLASWAYVIWYRNQKIQERNTIVKLLQTSKEARKQLALNYDASLTLLDSLTGQISLKEREFASSSRNIAQLQGRIRELLAKETLTREESERAGNAVRQLNEEIAKLRRQKEKLRADNAQLAEEAAMLTRERDEYKGLRDALENETLLLAEKLNRASTLTTRDIKVQGYKYRNGKPVRLTKSLRKADRLLLSFNVYNRIIDAGKTNIFIVIQDPEGNLVTTANAADEAGDGKGNEMKAFTAVLPISVEPGVETNVEYQWEKPKKFRHGSYVVAVYHNSFKVGETDIRIK